VNPVGDEATLKQLADYERISGVIWIVFGALQVLFVFTAIAGIWNIFAGISRLRMAKLIERRDASVPASYESVTQLVIIAVINALFGAMIGIVFVGFDFYVRDKVLQHQSLFTGQVEVDDPPTTNDLDALERMARMRDGGILTEVEFAAQKRRILGL